MVRWSLSTELFSAIILVLLMLSYYGLKQSPTHRGKMFHLCLWLSMSSILLNALCVITIAHADAVPLGLNLFLNSLYFFITVLMCSVMAEHLFELILEHVYDSHCLPKVRVLLTALTVLFAAAVLWNLHSGILFSFDAQRAYHRGPLNGLGYMILAVELAALTLCYLRNRPGVGRDMVRVMRTLPPLVVLMIIFQRLFPEILLNGAIVTMADLILYISFQNRRVELDSLTGAGNRKSFCNELSLRLASGQRFQVILLGLQHFADVNHRFGHRTGDAFLYETARELEKIFPEGRVFRSGNVEFAFILPFPGDGGAARLQALREHFEKPMVLGKSQAILDIRLADLLCGGESWTTEQVLESLEYCLDLARKIGGEPVRFHGRTVRLLQQKKDLVSLMHQALTEKRFQVWYQPVWDVAAGAFTSAEALLRLFTPEGEPVPPSEFIPIAEECGFIDELTGLVLENVCRLLAGGRFPELQSVSVNLSMQQFLDPNLTERLTRCLETYALPASRLKIEITERVASQDTERTRAVLDELSDRGIYFYLDDFGTGWANLSCALDLPFQCVKLDQSLLANYPDQSRNRHLVDGLISLFHRMGLRIVIEGVETRQQADTLAGCAVDWLQGYYLAKPMPEAELASHLKLSAKPASPGGFPER